MNIYFLNEINTFLETERGGGGAEGAGERES